MNENQTHQTAGTETPVDNFVRTLIADIKSPAPQNIWIELGPDDASRYPRYRFHNADGNIVTLTCDMDGDICRQHTLRVVDLEGNPLMHSMEWKTADSPSELGTLYALLRDRCHPTKPEKVETASGFVNPEQTDCFIRALVRDAKMQRPKLSWTRQDQDDKIRYYSTGLGKCQSSIWLQRDYEDEDSDSYTLQYVRDGEMILSCTETAKRTENPDCQLRELYHLVAKNDVQSDEVLVSVPEIHRFIADTSHREMLERIHGESKDKPVLVGDLFRQATLHRITHEFVVAAIDHCPGLSSNPLEKCRLQHMAEYMVGAIRCAKREPNGATFTLRATGVAYEAPGIASRTVRMSSAPQHISNACITWSDIFADADISPQAKINRTCVLVLMAILKDELP